MDPSKFNDLHSESSHYMSLCLTEAKFLFKEHFGKEPADHPELVVKIANEMMRYTTLRICQANSGEFAIAENLYEISKAIGD